MVNNLTSRGHEGSIPALISPKDIIIPVMGITGSGKSTFVSHCTEERVDVGHGLISCTSEVSVYSLRYRDHIIRLIDTPGFDDTKKPDVEILNEIAYWLSKAYSSQPKLLLSGILYLHPIHEPRLQGTAKKNLTMFKLLCGEESLRCVVLATTMWDKVKEQDGLDRQQELTSTDRFWGNMVSHGSQVFRHQNHRASAFKILDHIIDNRRHLVLDIQRQLMDENLPVEETNAGQELRRSILKEKDRAESRLKRNQDDLKEALELQTEENTQALLAEQEKFQNQIKQKEKSLELMKLDHAALQAQQEAQFKEEEKRMEDERRQHKEKMAKMDKDLEESQKAREVAAKQVEAQEKGQLELAMKNLESVKQKDLNTSHELIQWQQAESRKAAEATQAAKMELMQRTMELQMARNMASQMEYQRQQMEAEQMKKYAKRGMQAGVAGATFGAMALACVVM